MKKEKRTYRRQFLMSILLLVSAFGLAQSPNVISFINYDGVYLRWQGQHSVNLEGYQVYRRSASNPEWELLNETPLRLITDNALINDLAAYKTGMFLKLFGIDDISSDITQDAYQNVLADPQAVSFMEVMCLVNPELGYILGEIYLDSTIVRDEVYTYQIQAVKGGQEELVGTSKAINANLMQSVPEAHGLIGEGLDQMNQLQWNRDRDLLTSGDLVTYRLYRADELLGSYEQVNDYGILPVQIRTGVDEPDDAAEVYLDKFLENGQDYFYHVKGVNAFGIESDPGITIKVTAGEDVIPESPLSLQASLIGLNLKLSWDGQSNDSGYKIYRSLKKRKAYETVFQSPVSLEKPFWVDTEIEPGNTYYYFVKNIKGKLQSESSDTLVFTFIDMNPPSAPQNVRATSDSEGIRIEWDENPESNIKGYEIERAADDEYTSRMLLNTFPIAKSDYTDSVSKVSQTTYGYVVYAVDSMDNRSLPSIMVKARMPDIVAPQTPIITEFKRDDKQVVLKWSAGVEDDLAGYRVYLAMGNDEMTQIGETQETSYTYVLDESGTYAFTVLALDEAGNESLQSEVFSLTYDADEFPPPPLDFVVKLNDDGHVELSWKAPEYNDIKGYYLMRTDVADGHVFDIGQLSGERTAYKDRFVTQGKTYRYMLKTYNSKWFFSSAENRVIVIETEE